MHCWQKTDKEPASFLFFLFFAFSWHIEPSHHHLHGLEKCYIVWRGVCATNFRTLRHVASKVKWIFESFGRPHSTHQGKIRIIGKSRNKHVYGAKLKKLSVSPFSVCVLEIFAFLVCWSLQFAWNVNKKESCEKRNGVTNKHHMHSFHLYNVMFLLLDRYNILYIFSKWMY